MFRVIVLSLSFEKKNQTKKEGAHTYGVKIHVENRCI